MAVPMRALRMDSMVKSRQLGKKPLHEEPPARKNGKIVKGDSAVVVTVARTQPSYWQEFFGKCPCLIRVRPRLEGTPAAITAVKLRH